MGRGWVDWAQEKGRFGSGGTCQIQTPFLGLISLHRLTRTCASNIVGRGPS